MKGYKLPRDKGGRSMPGYPKGINSGSETPSGYQKEHRAHRPSGKGTKIGAIKRGK